MVSASTCIGSANYWAANEMLPIHAFLADQLSVLILFCMCLELLGAGASACLAGQQSLARGLTCPRRRRQRRRSWCATSARTAWT